MHNAMSWLELTDSWLAGVRGFFDAALASTGFVALVSAFIGTGVGAWFIHLLARRAAQKRQLLDELRSIRLASALSFAVCNIYMGAKRQHMRPTRNQFVQHRQEFEAFERLAAANRGPSAPIFSAKFDLRSLASIKSPIDFLMTEVLGKVDLRPRALVALTSLMGAVDGVDQAIRMRQELVDEFRQNRWSVPEQVRFYLGIESGGATDTRFAENVDALYTQTDDCIYFSKVLSEGLVERATKLHKSLVRKFGNVLPAPRSPDWTMAERDGLIPPREQYADWERGFRDEPASRRFARLRTWLNLVLLLGRAR